MAFKHVAITLLLGAALVACASKPKIPETAIDKTFVFEEALLGTTVGTGSIKTITGVDRGFTATLNGTWDGETLTLVEDFVYDDGEIDQKTWRLTRLENGEYEGTREDVVGAARGYQDGNTMRLEYLIDLPTGQGKTTRVGFRDVLAFQADGTVINNATVGYRGFRVGRVSLTIVRAE